MTNDSNKNNDKFINSVKDVKPLKKSNRLKKKIVEKKIPKTVNLKAIDTNHNQNEKKIQTKPKNLSFEKTNINKKIKKNIIKINKKIDLHGYSLNEAKNIFEQTINECFTSQKRCILFITGKGVHKKNDDSYEKKLFYGKIRTEFFDWVREKKFTNKILSFEQANPEHGGDGAFLIYLRKNKY